MYVYWDGLFKREREKGDVRLSRYDASRGNKHLVVGCAEIGQRGRGG